MIQYKYFEFAAPPRTGTTWFMHAAQQCGLGDGFKASVHEPFPDEESPVLRISMCRHPYHWLVSYHLALEGGACGIPCVDKLSETSKRNHSVEAFIRDYLDTMPGQVTEIFRTYKADSILRMEDLPWCAIELFESYGVSEKITSKLHTAPILNARIGEPHLVNKVLRRQVVEAEWDLCNDFDYYG